MRTLSLFSGYGGLDLAVEHVLGSETAYVADIDKGACKILEHRFPRAENLGDVSAVDYRSLGQIDVITGGFPCQDVSTAGKRAGMKDGTRSGLWSEMHRAIDELRPRLVVIENVRGLLSAEADSDVEPCPWCVGDESGPSMRALGAVLADLADIGYDARWCGLRAADVGAPHGRFRVFILATPADAERREQREPAERGLRAEPGRSATPAADTDRERHERAGSARYGRPGPADGDSGPVALLPTPDANMGNGGRVRSREALARGDRQVNLNDLPRLLPTPAVNDMGEGKTPEAWDVWTAKMQAKHGNGNGHGASLAIEAQRLTESVDVHAGGRVLGVVDVEQVEDVLGFSGGDCDFHTSGIAAKNEAGLEKVWGEYAPAIARWESLTRPAPAPTEPTGKGGAHRLSPRFTEWMMGLPNGWITDVPSITRNEALKACGNGVVPQQAAAAIEWLLNASIGQLDLLAMEG